MLSKGADLEPSFFAFFNPEWAARLQGHHHIVAEIQKVAAERQFQTYLAEVQPRKPNHYLTSYSIFGETYNFGCPAEKKKAAAEALATFAGNKITKSQRAELEKNHGEALGQGRLGDIYQSLLQIR